MALRAVHRSVRQTSPSIDSDRCTAPLPVGRALRRSGRVDRAGARAALAVLCLALAGTAAAAPRTTAVIGMAIEPPGLDPTVAAPVAVGQVTWQNVFEGLVRLDRHGAIRPQLARSWTVSPDGLTYTFALQPGVRFQDGTPFDAGTAKFTLDRARGPGSVNPQKQFFAAIDAVAAPYPLTLVLHLKQPSADLLYWLGWPCSVMVAPNSADHDRTDPVGTGPFKVARWVRGDRVDLVRDPAYWDAARRPALEGATFRFVADPEAQAAALRTGGLDAVPELGAPEVFKTFVGEPKFKAVAGHTELKVVAGMNDARPPFDDVRVRRALMMAVDRRALIDAASGGFGTPIGSHYAPEDPGFLDLTGVLPYDPAKARALLAAAGHADGLSFTLKVPQMAYASRTAEVLQAMFADVGVTATIVPTEFPAAWISEVFTKHDFDMTIIAHAEPLDIGIYARSNYYFGFHDLSFDAAVATAESALDPAARDAAYGEAQRILAEKVPALFLYTLPKLGVWDAKLDGLWADEPIPSNDLTEAHWVE